MNHMNDMNDMNDMKYICIMVGLIPPIMILFELFVGIAPKLGLAVARLMQYLN